MPGGSVPAPTSVELGDRVGLAEGPGDRVDLPERRVAGRVAQPQPGEPVGVVGDRFAVGEVHRRVDDVGDVGRVAVDALVPRKSAAGWYESFDGEREVVGGR